MKKNKYILYFIPLIILFVLFLQLLMNNGLDNKQNKIRIEFPEIERDSSVFGIVKLTRNYTNSIPKGALLITLEDGTKFTGSADALPKEIKVDRKNIVNLFLYNFLELGDTIYKPPHKDSLYVLKNGKKYTFYYPSKEIIDEILNKQ